MQTQKNCMIRRVYCLCEKVLWTDLSALYAERGTFHGFAPVFLYLSIATQRLTATWYAGSRQPRIECMRYEPFWAYANRIRSRQYQFSSAYRDCLPGKPHLRYLFWLLSESWKVRYSTRLLTT